MVAKADEQPDQVAAKAFEDTEARLRGIVDTAVDAIVTIDEHGRIDSFNRSAERLFGYSAEETIGQNISLLMPSPYRELHDSYIAAYLATGSKKIIGIGREVVAQRKDGTIFPIELAVSEVFLSDRRIFTGFIRDIWFRADKTGIYRGQCAELCGKEHGFMPIVVRVVSQEDYSKWVGERKKAMAASADDPNKTWTLPELAARGERVYAANCVACHQAQGQGTPAIKAPALAGNKFVMGAHNGSVDTVLNGRPGTAMQAFKGQLSDTEIAAVITYARNSFGNKANEVQPAEVKARRK